MRCTRGERRLRRAAVFRVFDFEAAVLLECVVDDLCLVVAVLPEEELDESAEGGAWAEDESGGFCRCVAGTG